MQISLPRSSPPGSSPPHMQCAPLVGALSYKLDSHTLGRLSSSDFPEDTRLRRGESILPSLPRNVARRAHQKGRKSGGTGKQSVSRKRCCWLRRRAHAAVLRRVGCVSRSPCAKRNSPSLPSARRALLCVWGVRSSSSRSPFSANVKLARDGRTPHRSSPIRSSSSRRPENRRENSIGGGAGRGKQKKTQHKETPVFSSLYTHTPCECASVYAFVLAGTGQLLQLQPNIFQ